MKKRLLLTTALSVVVATAAWAQSPSGSTSTDKRNEKPTSAASSSTSNTSSGTSSSATSTTPSQAQSGSSTNNSQAQSSQPAQNSNSNQAQSSRPAQGSNTSSTNNQAQSSQPAQNSTNNQAQRTPSNNQTPSTNQAQQSPSSNQAQQAPSGSNTNRNTAEQPSNRSTASTNESRSSTSASVNLNDQQRTRVAESITKLNAKPVTNINFSVSVGTAVPRDIRLETVPAAVVDIVPQYRGYSFFVAREDIVIVDPASYKIVAVLPRSGGARASTETRSRVAVTDKDREIIRKHMSSRPEGRTVGSSSSNVVIRRGERLPDSVEVEEFPETVYRDAPELRDYRYIERDNRTYLVEPSDRTVIEEIDR